MGDAYEDYERRAFRQIEKVERKMAKLPKGAISASARVSTKMGALLTPEQIASSGTEHAHQSAIFQWIATGGARTYAQAMDLLFAIPNGGDRRPSVAAALKAEGVKSGVPDMFWSVPRIRYGAESVVRGGYHGLWIELKKPSEWGKREKGQVTNGRSENQAKWQRRLLEQGYAVATAFGWQAACWVLVTYWQGKLIMPEDGDCLWATACEHPPVVERITTNSTPNK